MMQFNYLKKNDFTVAWNLTKCDMKNWLHFSSTDDALFTKDK